MGELIVIAGGGTGGHIFPALAIASELKKRDASREFLFLGSRKGLETRLVPAAGFALRTLRLGGLKGMSIGARALSLVQAAAGVVRIALLFLGRRPSVVIGVGGYASGPAVLAALALRVPTLIHEQNAHSGMTNRWLARWVDAVAVSFPGTIPSLGGRGIVTGNPIRQAFFAIPPYERNAGPLNLLIFGGSRGAQRLNRAALAALERLEPVRNRISIVHQTGEADLASTEARYRESGFEATALAFIDDMPARLAAADLVLCRAGAGTIFELAAAGRASVLVPYPGAGAHQEPNAVWMTEQGAAILVRDSELDGARLAQLVREALDAPSELLARACAARRLARPDAASSIATMAENLMGDRASPGAGR